MRRLLIGLLIACLAGAAILFAVDATADRATCVPVNEPVQAGMRIMTSPSDGCDRLRTRQQLGYPTLLMLSSALAAGVALAWRSRWRLVALLPSLPLLLHAGALSLFAIFWRSECGPIATYTDACVSLGWLYVPWTLLALAVVLAMITHARRDRARPRA